MPKIINGLKHCPNDGTYPKLQTNDSNSLGITQYHIIFCPKCNRQTHPSAKVKKAKQDWNNDIVVSDLTD